MPNRPFPPSPHRKCSGRRNDQTEVALLDCHLHYPLRTPEGRRIVASWRTFNLVLRRLIPPPHR